MQLTFLATLLVVPILVGAGVLAYLGWKDWVERRRCSAKRWRDATTFGALTSISLTAMLFVGYATHNAVVGGDRGGGSNTLFCIRLGTYLAVVTVLLSLGGKGLGRWAALLGGCLILFLWFWQGMSL